MGLYTTGVVDCGDALMLTARVEDPGCGALGEIKGLEGALSPAEQLEGC